MSSAVHIDNAIKEILILSEEPTQGLDDTTLAAEAKYPIIFRQPKKIKRLVWVCTIIKATVSYLLMLQKHINSKQKILK